MSVNTAASVTAPDFADVYAEHLSAVWRFVRSRVPDHHEAYDVTSDVFVRAWRNWDRFDPTRGPVEPWLFTIAYRTVTDWWRRRRDVPVDDVTCIDDPPQGGPEEEALRRELLTQLGVALERLRPHERDVLALRFAARLSMPHVAEVLGTTTGAAKMLVHRTLEQLRRERFADAVAPTDAPAADLEAVIDDVLARGHGSIASDDLRGMLLALAALHEPEVPADLPRHVAVCVQCAAQDDAATPTAPAGPGRPTSRGRAASVVAAITAFLGVCLVCTVSALQTLAFALGIGAAGYVMHLAAVVGAPLVAWMVHRGTRRHGRDRAFRLARAGAILMLPHALLHVGFEVLAGPAIEDWLASPAGTLLTASHWLATGLLVAGALLNLVESQRWRERQAAGLRSVLVAPAG